MYDVRGRKSCGYGPKSAAAAARKPRSGRNSWRTSGKYAPEMERAARRKGEMRGRSGRIETNWRHFAGMSGENRRLESLFSLRDGTFSGLCKRPDSAFFTFSPDFFGTFGRGFSKNGVPSSQLRRFFRPFRPGRMTDLAPVRRFGPGFFCRFNREKGRSSERFYDFRTVGMSGFESLSTLFSFGSGLRNEVGTGAVNGRNEGVCGRKPVAGLKSY